MVINTMPKKLVYFYISRAENYIGDIAYEMAVQNIGSSDNDEEVMKALENLDDDDMRYCRHEALLSAGVFDEEMRDYIIKKWEERGF